MLQFICFQRLQAEMSEWSKEHDWKSCEVQASAGSNPVLCANNILLAIAYR